MPDLEEDSAVSRRLVLKGAAGAGAAGIALGGMAVSGSGRARTSSPASAELRGAAEPVAGETAGEAIVVHVRDVAAGEIDIYRGTTETRLVDRELAARLARASR
jgi:hypothetical protein